MTNELLQDVRQYLHDGRKRLIARPPSEHLQRIISYRTELSVAYNQAYRDGAAEVLAYLREEHEWALAKMCDAGITFEETEARQ